MITNTDFSNSLDDHKLLTEENRSLGGHHSTTTLDDQADAAYDLTAISDAAAVAFDLSMKLEGNDSIRKAKYISLDGEPVDRPLLSGVDSAWAPQSPSHGSPASTRPASVNDEIKSAANNAEAPEGSSALETTPVPDTLVADILPSSSDKLLTDLADLSLKSQSNDHRKRLQATPAAPAAPLAMAVAVGTSENPKNLQQSSKRPQGPLNNSSPTVASVPHAKKQPNGRPLARSNRPLSSYLLAPRQMNSDSDDDDNVPNANMRAANDTFNATIEDSFPPKAPENRVAALHNLGPQEQRERLQQLENENFQLKLKVTILQRHVHMNDSTKELYSLLAQAQSRETQYKNEVQDLNDQLANANARAEAAELRGAGVPSGLATEVISRSRPHSDASNSYDQLELKEKDEMIAALVNAQEFYEQVIQGMLDRTFVNSDEDVPDTLEDKLIFIEKTYLKAIQLAHETREKLNAVSSRFQSLVDLDQKDRGRQMTAQMTLNTIAELFNQDDASTLPDIVADLLSNNNALEEQLAAHLSRLEDMEAEVEMLQRQLKASAEPGSQEANAQPVDELRRLRLQVRELTEANHQLSEAATRASTRNYDIMRQFFQRMTENFGHEWGQDNGLRLRAIVEEARRTSRSKLPMLIDLMMEIVDNLSNAVRAAEHYPATITELEQRVRSLESLLTQELVRAGADPVLLARYKDLQHKLKVEEEKRKNEYIGYQRSLMNLQNPV